MTKYLVKPVDSKQEWETFLRKTPYNIFVQSWYYGDFYRLLGDDAFVLGVYKLEGETKTLVAGSLVTKVNAKRGKFFYLPYGPILDYHDSEQVSIFFEELTKIAKHKQVDFIRVSPFVEDSKELRTVLKQNGLKKAPIHMIAEITTMIDLEQEEVDLLKNMNQNHRNLIRRCTKEGVEIKTSEEVLDVKVLHDLLQTTAKRHKFTPFSLKYLENEFKTFQNRGEAKLYFAYHQGDLLGVAMIIFHGNSAIYRHAASSDIKSKIPSAYGIQWEAIQEAKRRNMKYYNFWGIAPSGNKKHPFYGITHFKKGFGGFVLNLVPAHDLPISKKYYFNWIVETLRRIKRGF